EKAPKHVELFLKLAAEGAYDGTRFHRVVKWGIIQGGDPLSRDPSKKNLWGSGGANKVSAELSDIKHVRGTVSSVLLPGRPESGANQCFIGAAPQAQPDGQYAAFGSAAEAIEVVDRISEAATAATGAPLKPPLIQKVTLRAAQPVP